jgi:hypothetical protein
MILNNDTKFERVNTMPRLKQEIIGHLFEFLSRKRQGDWYKFKGEFKYDGVEYLIECDCSMDNQMFTYKNLLIEHKQQVIEVDELVKQGLLN